MGLDRQPAEATQERPASESGVPWLSGLRAALGPRRVAAQRPRTGYRISEEEAVDRLYGQRTGRVSASPAEPPASATGSP